MPEEDLLAIQSTLNPYAQTTEEESKFVVLSLTNFKADYWRAFKALSLFKFMNQVTTEAQDWVDLVVSSG